MGRIGKVIKSFIAKLSGSSTDAQFSSVEEFSGDQRTVQVFGPCNEDFAPPENCKTLNIPLGRGRGFLVSAAYHNQAIAPVAVHGERRIYSTNQAGDAVKTEIFLKQDGTILIDNGKVTITASPSGLLEIVTDGNTEITSAKTIIKNDVDIIGNVDITGSLDASVRVAAPVVTAATSMDAPTIAAATSMSVNSKDVETHTHSQPNDSGGDAESNTSAML